METHINAHRTNSIDSIVSEPFVMEGVDLKFYPKNHRVPATIHFPDNKIESIEKLKALYVESLFTWGYCKTSELWNLHNENVNSECVKVYVHRLRKTLDKDSKGSQIIKTRRCSGDYEGGYYIGYLENHRNEPENIIEKNGHRLNKVTGCLSYQKRIPIFLMPFETEIMYFLMRTNERPVRTDFLQYEAFNEEKSSNVIKMEMSKLRKKIKPRLNIVKPKDSKGYLLITNDSPISH